MNIRNISFALGVLLGFTLAAGLTWAQVEASFYGFPHYSDRGWSGFSCPRLMTRNEQAEIHLQISNPGQSPLRQMVGVMISAPGPLLSDQQVVSLQPGERKVLSWSVSAEQNLDLGFFIFARAYRYPTYLGPMAQATCGILVLSLPGSGKVLLPIWLILVGVLLVPPLARDKAFLTVQEMLTSRALALATVLSLFIALGGWWPLGLLSLAAQVILIAVIIAHHLLSRP
ncbi:MAG: hypothetical protein ACK8QZ_11490 [Anaerolineales bacterium]